MRRINLFSGPGAGKSTIAARLYAHLRQNGYPSTELIREYVKDWAYMNRVPNSFDQVFLFGSQLHAEDFVLQHGVMLAITDSPIMLTCFYAYQHKFVCYKELIEIAKQFEYEHPSCNIFLDRGEIHYQQEGRYENYDQAIERDKNLEDFLVDNNVRYHKIKTIDFDKIVETVECHIAF